MPRNIEQELDQLREQVQELANSLAHKQAASQSKMPVSLQPFMPTQETDDIGINALSQLIENRMAEKVLNCIGSYDRLTLLLALLKEPMTVAALVEKCGYTSTGQVYHHLKPLMAADLIAETKKTPKGTYAVQPHRVRGIVMLLTGIHYMVDAEYAKGNWEPKSEIHKGATMVDERYMVTEEQQQKIIGTFFSSVDPLVLHAFPPKEKKKLVILNLISEQFQTGKKYTEKEINGILKPIYEDYVTIRRYLIEYGFLDRTVDCSEYWVKEPGS